MYEHEQIVTIDEKCINVVEKVYMLPGYDACMAGSWEKHEAKQGNRGCLFQGCNTV